VLWFFLLTSSTASAITAGLAAYLRGKNNGPMSPADVKNRILELAYSHKGNGYGNAVRPKAIYNGDGVCGATGSKNGLEKRQDTCPLPGNPQPAPGEGTPITFSPGPPSPTCLTGCGKLCQGTPFCNSPCLQCPGPNPDFPDPLNPDSPQNPQNPSYTQTGGSSPTSPPPTTTVSPTSSPPGTTTTPNPSPIPTWSNGDPLRYNFFIEQDGSREDVKILYKGYGNDAKVNYDICHFKEDWEQNGGSLIWPTHLTFNYMGTTCKYTETNKWSSANKDDVVGKLSCAGYADGTCFKADLARGQCDPKGFIFTATNCGW
jgi:hypothetical protein